MKPFSVPGGTFSDPRGRIDFVNDFHFEGVKRFYIIENIDTRFVRAWQGHREEKKFFYVLSGSILVAWVKIDDWVNPSSDLKAESIILKSDEPRILIIPPGYANGMRSLEPASRMMVMSDHHLAASLDDKIRFPADLWFNFGI